MVVDGDFWQIDSPSRTSTARTMGTGSDWILGVRGVAAIRRMAASAGCWGWESLLRREAERKRAGTRREIAWKQSEQQNVMPRLLTSRIAPRPTSTIEQVTSKSSSEYLHTSAEQDNEGNGYLVVYVGKVGNANAMPCLTTAYARLLLRLCVTVSLPRGARTDKTKPDKAIPAGSSSLLGDTPAYPTQSSSARPRLIFQGPGRATEGLDRSRRASFAFELGDHPCNPSLLWWAWARAGAVE